MINGRQFTVDHDEEGVNFNMQRNMCGLCRCDDGTFEDCMEIDCPYVRDDDGNNMCTAGQRMYSQRQSFQNDCNMCRCLNGRVECTRRDCSDDEDDDDDDRDTDNEFAACRRMPRSPVCATTRMRTFPNRCAALAAGFERFEITEGACSRDVSS